MQEIDQEIKDYIEKSEITPVNWITGIFFQCILHCFKETTFSCVISFYSSLVICSYSTRSDIYA